MQSVSARSPTRPLTIVAQDPGVRFGGKVLLTQVEVPAETLAPGPWGYRVQVVDYNATTGEFYSPLRFPDNALGELVDPFQGKSADQLLANPQFHQQNVYAIAMRILARFEFALGRRVSWSFRTHQLKIAPHAFAQANAFFSPDDEGLYFGYFPGTRGTIFTCLSHDVVAHETTHALLDGLRSEFTTPSSPDQAAFHEGFSDIVALLSVFALSDVVQAILTKGRSRSTAVKRVDGRTLILASEVTVEKLKKSLLLGLADEMGQELSGVRGQALRRSAELPPGDYFADPAYDEPHRRGELLVAAVLTAFLRVIEARLLGLDAGKSGWLDLERVIEEAATAADQLLTMSIRAIDYLMPVHLTFSDFLSALLTADCELCPNDKRYQYRNQLLRSFADYKIAPSSTGTATERGIWLTPDLSLNYDAVHFKTLQTDRDEVFRFIWENRTALGLCDRVYTRVLSVRPCLRIGPDGFLLRETVAEYLQSTTIPAQQLEFFDIDRPPEMPADATVRIEGGGTLVFDEFGRLKFNIRNRIDDGFRQSARIAYLWRLGYFRDQKKPLAGSQSFAELHRLRALNARTRYREAWT
ncbi:MAG: hypothetical protein JSS02_15470 [Planctomycetes bacterium]|nr:hypothetical protein [Planctomycetota bacterium]